MDRRTRENLLYVAEDFHERFGRRVCLVSALFVLSVGVFWGFQKVDAFLTPTYAEEREAERKEKEQKQEVQQLSVGEIQQAHLAISKIGVQAPITFVQSTNPSDFLEPLEEGVTHYPSSLPGQKGTSIILGHSAPPGWFGELFDGVFSNISDLKEGDVISVTINETVHQYQVQGQQQVLNRGQDIPPELLEENKSRLLLLSCWPPGINNKRIMVEAHLL